jgi:predicted Zn-dependent peptidase
MQNQADFKTYEYPNGFRLAWQQTPTETIFANLHVNHGALHEIKGEEGTAHFLEHMLIEGGTAKYTPQEQAQIRDKFGYTNARTSRTSTCIPWGMVSNDFNAYLDMASQMVFFPRLDQTVLEHQKEIVLREIAKSKGAPDFQDMARFFWPNVARDREHTYFILGEESVIKELNINKLRNFHSRGYSPHNMILMVSGKVPHDIIDKVGEHFAEIPRNNGSPFVFSPVAPLENQAVRYSFAPDLLNRDNPNDSNTRIMMGCVVPDEFHEDSAALSVASEILGGSWTTGLKRRIRSECGMAYEIGSGYSGTEKLGYFGINGRVITRRQEEAINIIFEEFRKLKNTLVDDAEVDRAKKRGTYDSANLHSPRFNPMISVDPLNVNVISRMAYTFDGRPPIGKVISEIQKVTSQDIRRVAKRYFPSDRENGKYVLLVRDPLNK